MIIEFTVYGNPLALKRHRTYTRDKLGRPLKYPIQVDASANDKADFLAKAMQYRPSVPLDEPILLIAGCYFARPQKHFNSKGQLRNDAPLWVTSKKSGDWDNLGKFISDALNGIFWIDDSIICWVVFYKQYIRNNESPRVYIRIQTANDAF